MLRERKLTFVITITKSTCNAQCAQKTIFCINYLDSNHKLFEILRKIATYIYIGAYLENKISYQILYLGFQKCLKLQLALENWAHSVIIHWFAGGFYL